MSRVHPSARADDLLERLRALAKSHARMGLYKAEEWIEWEAADEIDRLTARVAELEETQRKFGTLMHERMDERDRLRAALQRIANDTLLCGRCTDIAREALAQQPPERTVPELLTWIDPYVEYRDMQVRLQRLIQSNGPLRAVAKAALALSRSSRSMVDPHCEMIPEALLTALESALEAAGYGMTEEEVAQAVGAPPPADVSRGT